MTEHIPLLKKGALVAQDPPAFESVQELEELEREALRNEVLHKWRQPRSLYLTVILCSVGAAVQGWDQTGSNGANLSWPLAFGVPDSGPNKTARNGWIVGVVNAGPYIASAFMCVVIPLCAKPQLLTLVVVVAGCPIPSTTISAAAEPSSYPPSSASCLSSAQLSPKPGPSCSSLVYS